MVKGQRTLTLGVSGEPQSFDPALQQSGGDQRWRWQATFDTLLRCDADGNVVPNAAQSYKLSKDAKTLTMKLRKGMTFSDGTPVNAAAAKATIKHMKKGGGSDAGRVAEVTVKTPDAHTVVLKAPRPTGQLPTFMCLAPGAIAEPKQISSGSVASVPVSSGPYKLDPGGSTSGSVYRFVKRDDYWNADAYAYDTVEFVTMSDSTARLNALMSGEIDGAVIDQDQAAEARDTGLHVLSNPGTWTGMYINDRAGKKIPALGDVRVRRAMNMVFDRKAIADHMFGGEAAPTTQIFNPGATAFEAKLDKAYPYDIARARRLMKEAGYADGFTIEVPSEADGSAVYNPLVIQQLGLLNIRVKEVPLTGPTAISDILGGRFPVMYARMSTSASSLFSIVEALEPGSIWNVMRTKDPKLQKLLEEAQVARGERGDEVYREINEYVVDQAWFVPWVAENTFFATRDASMVPEMTDPFRFNPYLSDFK
ncbi:MULTISPECIES: ABC transporter substrate-binding protein [unclassified Streptomyces]|uniref:ABC transporter substrate-binding protein n=1 Tax=unclassified Streptomyces TaxID=2593676 RepID=UPI002E17F705|nr:MULTISPECIES: ABC transporter substrate-binding protein [unclassified Streptomyces]